MPPKGPSPGLPESRLGMMEAVVQHPRGGDLCQPLWGGGLQAGTSSAYTRFPLPPPPQPPWQTPDYQSKKMETRSLRKKLFHIKKMVSEYDKHRG